MRGIVAAIITGLLVYVLNPSLNALVYSLPFTVTPSGYVTKILAIGIIWLIIYAIICGMTKKS